MARPGLVVRPTPGCEPSRAQCLTWGIAIASAAALLGALIMRLGATLELPQWWMPIALAAGVTLADFASGLLHWAADTWGRADLPVIGPRILVPFRVHHLNPNDFRRRTFLDTNGDIAALSIVPLLALLWVPLDEDGGPAVAVAGLGFCAPGGPTNQIHQWAHMPQPSRLVVLLQRAGLLLQPRAHARHHWCPYARDYCITTGWCNRPLEAIGFFRRLERAVTGVTGAVPRQDEQHAPGDWPATLDDGRRHV